MYMNNHGQQLSVGVKTRIQENSIIFSKKRGRAQIVPVFILLNFKKDTALPSSGRQWSYTQNKQESE